MLRRGRDEAGRRGGGLFPVAPDGEVAKAEGVPPERKHGTVEVQNTLACDAGGGGTSTARRSKTRSRSAPSVRESRCQRERVSRLRAWERMVVRATLRASGVCAS